MLLRERRHVNAAAAATLGGRMAGELAAHDSSAALALEGLVLQLLAAAGRAASGSDQRAADWLRTIREILHDRVPEVVSLHELGDAVGRHPSHVARAFRRAHGVTVAQYVRALRLEWAAAELAASDASVARIANDAGFADQSHFTRAFRHSHGVTPGRYRRLVRASS
jgi:AraC family transcriptional regulator